MGVLGSSMGVALGVIGALAVHPHLAHFASRLIGPVKWPVLPLVGAAALGTAAATLAALGPARSAARLSTLDALAGRTPVPRKPGKLAGAGMVGVAIGVILTAWATVRHGPWILAVGLILTVALLGIGACVCWNFFLYKIFVYR